MASPRHGPPRRRARRAGPGDRARSRRASVSRMAAAHARRPRASATTSAPSWSRPATAACRARASGMPATATGRSSASRRSSGAPRSTFRRNDEVLTFLPETRVVTQREARSLELFPEPAASAATAPSPSSTTRAALGSDRVAGFDADVVQLAPKDALRFGYRIWSEKKIGPGGQAADASTPTAACSSRRPSPNCSSTRRCASSALAQMMAVHRGLARREGRAAETTAAGRRLGAEAARSPASSR